MSPNHLAVEFVLPYDQIHQILKISFYIYADPTTTFRAHIYSSPGHSILFAAEVTPLGTGWFDIDVWGYFIMVTGHLSPSPCFLVTIEYLTDNKPEIGFDAYPTYLYRHSLLGTPGDWHDVGDVGNFMIRAQTEKMSFKQKPSDPPNQPVGGDLFLANKPAILAPYLALIGAVAVVAVIVKRRKRLASSSQCLKFFP